MPEPEPEESGPSFLPEDIDAMFEDEPEPEAVGSLIDEADTAGEYTDDDGEDPEPIPEVFTADEQEPEDDEDESRPPFLKIAAALFLILVIGAGSTFWFAREMVASLVPGGDQLYESLGLPIHGVGDGLQIRNLKFAQELESGLEVLIVRGEIVNVEETKRAVPVIRAILLDPDDQELQHMDTAPLKSELAGGEAILFKARIKEPSPLRRRVKVKFVDPAEGPDDAGGETK